MSRSLKGNLWSVITLLILILWCTGPLLWQFITSIKPNTEITALPVSYWPSQVTLEHYASLFTRKPFARYLWNSFFISASATLLCLAIAAPAAYAFARLRPKGGGIVITALVVVALFPGIAFFFPLFEWIRALGWINHPIALIIPYAAFNLPLAILFLSAFLRSIPKEIDEAGRIDGLGHFGVLWRLILPLSAPGISTVAILVFIASWNEFLFALTFLPKDEAKTATVAVASLSGGSLYELPWGLIGTSIVICVAPLLVLVALFQRKIVSGLTQGASTH